MADITDFTSRHTFHRY